MEIEVGAEKERKVPQINPHGPRKNRKIIPS